MAEDLLGKDPPRSSAAHSDSAYCDMPLPLREPTWLNSLLDSPCCFVLGHLALSACLWYPLLALTCLYRLRKCTILLIYKLLCCCLCLCCTNRQGRDPGSTPGSQLSYRPRAHADAGAPTSWHTCGCGEQRHALFLQFPIEESNSWSHLSS